MWARHGGAVDKGPHLARPGSHMGASSIPAAPLPFQLPACGPGKQSRTAQSFRNLHLRGRPGRGSWLQIGIVSAIALIWGVNHLPLCLSSLYIRLSNK